MRLSVEKDLGQFDLALTSNSLLVGTNVFRTEHASLSLSLIN